MRMSTDTLIFILQNHGQRHSHDRIPSFTKERTVIEADATLTQMTQPIYCLLSTAIAVFLTSLQRRPLIQRQQILELADKQSQCAGSKGRNSGSKGIGITGSKGRNSVMIENTMLSKGKTVISPPQLAAGSK